MVVLMCNKETLKLDSCIKNSSHANFFGLAQAGSFKIGSLETLVLPYCLLLAKRVKFGWFTHYLFVVQGADFEDYSHLNTCADSRLVKLAQSLHLASY
jgi:hypothetical protein